MTALNLKADTPEQKKIKEYLQANASDVLANKINNGVRIQKDGKTLINRKTLVSFMTYAESEARKLVAKGAKCACIDDPTVYGWAIHYFEEDSIEGTLYNEDGTEHKPTIKAAAKPTPKEPPKQKQQQPSLFDMFAASTQETVAEHTDDEEEEDDGEELNNDYTPEEIAEEDDEEPTEEECAEAMEQEQQTSLPLPPIQTRRVAWYQNYLSVKEKYKDYILFYRLGDFYEMYGEDATTAANILDLTLTGRDCGLTERVPMAGIPFHAADAYMSKLVSRGYRVAIAERINGEFQEKVIEASLEELNIDETTGEVLPVEEMRKFDGDIEEPKKPVDEDDDFPPIDTKAYDIEALSILDTLMGSTIILR